MTEPILLSPTEPLLIAMVESTISSRTIYRGRVIKLHVDRVRLDNGRETTREIVEHPGAAAIVPILDDGRLLLIKQYRAATRRKLMEIPAGTLEPDESPLSCAKRELTEETGYVARRVRKLFSCYLAPGYSTEKIHFFLATHLVPGQGKQEYDEAIDVQAVDLWQALKAIERGKIQDAKTISALYYLAARDVTKRSANKTHRF
jgi:ADP-ribose pyrophosphatase